MFSKCYPIKISRRVYTEQSEYARIVISKNGSVPFFPKFTGRFLFESICVICACPACPRSSGRWYWEGMPSEIHANEGRSVFHLGKFG